MINKASIILFGIALFLSMSLALASADSWGAPATVKYESANKKFAFEVIPAGQDSSKTGAPETKCTATAYDSKNEKIWSAELTNSQAPVSAFISDDGSCAVTLDNWGSIGHGDNVIAVYAAPGKLVKKFSLEDIFSKEELEAFSSSFTSRQWRQQSGGAYFEKNSGIFVIRLADNGAKSGRKEIKIDTAKGEAVK